MTDEVRVRVAPSPTGYPHVGNATTFLFNYAFARSRSGKFILRIEDTDRARSKPEYERAIFDALRWLGLEYDEGPDVGGPYGPYRQSERNAIYSKYAEELTENGHAYYCFCASERIRELRERQQREKLPIRYDGLCTGLSAEEVKGRLERGEAHVIRLRVPREGSTEFTDLLRGAVVFQNSEIDDQVLIKSDGFPTYHMANVVDDHLMRITHVIRAEEWISSTPKHILLYRAFGWTPPAFAHLSILRNEARAKLKKREGGGTSINDFRQQGYLPEALVNFMALMGYSMPDGREVFPLSDLVSSFSLERLNTTAPVFDMVKLEWMNGVYIRAMEPVELAGRIADFSPAAKELAPDYLAKILPLVRERMKTLADFEPTAEFLWKEIRHDAGLLAQKGATREGTIELLEKYLAGVENLAEWTKPALEEFARVFADSSGWKAKDFYMTIRVAVSGKTATPPLFESMEVIGREQCLRRLRGAIDSLKDEGGKR